MPWIAIYTSLKSENKVAEQLLRLVIDAYSQVVTQIKQWSNREKKVELPPISSYIFVNLEERHRNTVFEVHGIVRYLYWLGKLVIIQVYEINLLKDILKGILTFVEVEGIQPGALLLPRVHFREKKELFLR